MVVVPATSPLIVRRSAVSVKRSASISTRPPPEKSPKMVNASPAAAPPKAIVPFNSRFGAARLSPAKAIRDPAPTSIVSQLIRPEASRAPRAPRNAKRAESPSPPSSVVIPPTSTPSKSRSSESVPSLIPPDSLAEPLTTMLSKFANPAASTACDSAPLPPVKRSVSSPSPPSKPVTPLKSPPAKTSVSAPAPRKIAPATDDPTRAVTSTAPSPSMMAAPPLPARRSAPLASAIRVPPPPPSVRIAAMPADDAPMTRADTSTLMAPAPSLRARIPWPPTLETDPLAAIDTGPEPLFVTLIPSPIAPVAETAPVAATETGPAPLLSTNMPAPPETVAADTATAPAPLFATLIPATPPLTDPAVRMDIAAASGPASARTPTPSPPLTSPDASRVMSPRPRLRRSMPLTAPLTLAESFSVIVSADALVFA